MHQEASLRLPAAAAALGTARFAETLLAELTPLLAAHPLLAAAAEQGGRIEPATVRLSLLAGDATRGGLRLGLFCEEIVGGCSCGDPPYSAPIYRQLTLWLDSGSETGRFRFAADE